MSGSIYVLSNPSMPGLLKIGKTRRTVSERMKELYDTGVPTPFKCEFNIFVPLDVHKAEKGIHRMLSKFRVNNSREFFKINTDEALFAIDAFFYAEYKTMDEALKCPDVSDEEKCSLLSAHLKTFIKGADVVLVRINKCIYKLKSDRTLTFLQSLCLAEQSEMIHLEIAKYRQSLKRE
jgi:hypothetical protein